MASNRGSALEAIEIEELVRKTWPRAGTTLFDQRAQALAPRLLATNDLRKSRVFAALDVARQSYEPTAADLYRIGVGIEDALGRATRRACDFQRLCARAWKWKVSARDRYIE